MRPSSSRSSRHAAFTLTELMVAIAIFAIGGGVVYPLLSGDIQLYARNFSINKSDNSLRYSLQMLKRDINMGIEPPQLMTYTSSGNTGTLTAASGSAVSAQAILVWVNLGPSFALPATVTPSSGITLTTSASPAPTVQVGDRLVIEDPAPYSTGMPDAKATCGATLSSPGRRITAVNNVTTTTTTVNQITTTTTSLTVSLDLTTPLPSGIASNQSAYIVREVAYAVTTVNNAAGKAVERDLIYYPTTANMSSSRLLVRDVDPLPQETDPNTNATIQPFNFYGGRGSLTPLSVCLPIRAIDYAQALNDRNLGGAATNTSGTEFDVYLRSTTQMAIKVRLD